MSNQENRHMESPSKWRLTWEVNIGQLIQVLCLIVAALYTYYNFQSAVNIAFIEIRSDLSLIRSDLRHLSDSEITNLENIVADHEQRIRKLERK